MASGTKAAYCISQKEWYDHTNYRESADSLLYGLFRD